MSLNSHKKVLEMGLLRRLELAGRAASELNAIFPSPQREAANFRKYMRKVEKISKESGDDPEKILATDFSFLGEKANCFATRAGNAVWLKTDFSDFYGSIPTQFLEQSIIEFWDEGEQRHRWVLSYSITFGNVHSPYAASRFSRLLRALMCKIFHIACLEYFDDIIACEEEQYGQKALKTMETFLNLFQNIAREKVEIGSELTVLGMQVGFDRAGRLSAGPKPGARQKLYDAADSLFAGEKVNFPIPVKKVLTLLGKAAWLILCARFGSASGLFSPLFKLLHRDKKLDHIRLDNAEEEATAAQCIKAIRELAFCLPEIAIDPAAFSKPRAHIYVDASMEDLGCVLFLPSANNDTAVVRMVSAKIPEAFKQQCKRVGRDIVARYEILATLLAFASFEKDLAPHTRLYLHTDNTWAQNALLKGYAATDAVISGIAQRVHWWCRERGYICWWAYVNTKLNIADAFSRRDEAERLQALAGGLQKTHGAIWRDAVFPFFRYR
jgi:hypothetical protein